uniref:Transcription factor MYC2 n=1 Tax=Rhizophora mucronata TaxID=61149 RepID=A0A2P2QYJ3_RHIMU
MVLCCCQRP